MPVVSLAGSRSARIAFASVVVVSLVVLFAPAGDVPSAPPGVDKVIHAVLFLALAATGRWAGLRAGVLVVSLVVLCAPAGAGPGAPPWADKVVHAVLFLALAATGRWAGLRPAVLVPALVLYAAGSEVLQGLAAIGRTTSLADWVADVAGLLAGLALWARLAGAARR